jgi:hypothetical protein
VPGWDRPRLHRRAADGDRSKSCDIAPACVPRTVRCTVPKKNLAVGLGAVVAPNVWLRRSRRQPAQSSTVAHHCGPRAERCRSGRGSPSDFIPKMERRQIYAGSDRHAGKKAVTLCRLDQYASRCSVACLRDPALAARALGGCRLGLLRRHAAHSSTRRTLTE